MIAGPVDYSLAKGHARVSYWPPEKATGAKTPLLAVDNIDFEGGLLHTQL